MCCRRYCAQLEGRRSPLQQIGKTIERICCRSSLGISTAKHPKKLFQLRLGSSNPALRRCEARQHANKWRLVSRVMRWRYSFIGQTIFWNQCLHFLGLIFAATTRLAQTLLYTWRHRGCPLTKRMASSPIRQPMLIADSAQGVIR